MNAGTARMHRSALAALAGVLLLLGACGGSCPRAIRIDDDLADPNPSRRTTAVAAVAYADDATQIPRLIEMLDDPDPAVRLAAHSTLLELTGRESAYRPWASPAARRAAVLEWRAWWASRTSASTSSRSSAPECGAASRTMGRGLGSPGSVGGSEDR